MVSQKLVTDMAPFFLVRRVNCQRPEPKPVEERAYAFSHVGGLKAVQGAREMPQVVAALPGGARAIVAGWFDDAAVERDARAHAGWQRIDYLGGVPHERAIEAIRDSVCGIVIDHPISNYLDSYSTKMFEYMACGVPVVATDAPHGPREVLDNGKWGDLVPVGAPQALAAAIIRTLDRKCDPDGGLRARSFTVEAAARRFAELLAAHGIVLRA